MAMVMKISFCYVIILVLCLDVVQVSCSLEHCPKKERRALLKLKEGVVDQSGAFFSWAGEDCCKWNGVGCDNKTGHVVKLDLHKPENSNEESWLKVNYLNPSILELEHLLYLDLSGVDLSNISASSFPSNLLELHVSNCQLNEKSEFLSYGNFSSLLLLDLSQNDFTGPIPTAIWNMTSLENLDLSHNMLFSSSSTLSRFDQLRNLQYLCLSENSFPGPLPSESFGALPRLKRLYLSGLEITGSIPLSFGNLSVLEELNLGQNQLSGAIPLFLGRLSVLQVLDLQYNQLSGQIPESLGRLSLIREMHLAANNLSGHIPKSFGGLSNLLELDISFNQLTDQIPMSLGRLSNMTSLDLRYNHLSGPIPVFLGGSSNLRMLRLSSNRLNGTIPESIGQLSQLTDLMLPFNPLEGVISEVHFAKLSNLKRLSLSSSSLSFKISPGWVPPFQLLTIHLPFCRIGPDFPSWLRTQTEFVFLNMSYTGISSSLPNWFKNLPNQLRLLDLSHNQIQGTIPKFSTPNNTGFVLYLGSNELMGSLPDFPSNTIFLDISNNSISGTIPNGIGEMLPKLMFLGLSRNQLTGSIPNSLCRITLLSYLDLSKNHLSGYIPQCWNQILFLQVLDLTSNSLSGPLPGSICHVSGLRSLRLGNNTFEGVLPSNLQYCTSLSIIDLGGNKLSGKLPAWIGESISTLKILRLRTNKFSGDLSPNICHLKDLHILDVAENNLSGSIPRCFYNFSAMNSKHSDGLGEFSTGNLYLPELSQVIKGKELEYIKILPFLLNIDLSSNSFVNQIPEELTRLSNVIGLNLSNNHLTGNIPKEIGQMQSLESLDLSRNRLSGTIPSSIAVISSPSHLNLSYNQLTGPIPIGNQLQTLNDPSIYEGNHDLCGVPLLTKCTGDEPIHNPSRNNDEGEFSMTWFFIGMASGVAVGFWVVFGVLVLKNNWRHAYFRGVSDLSDRVCFAVSDSIIFMKKHFKCNED